MANPLYNLFNQSNNANNSPMGNVMKMVNEFNRFKKNFSGNPQQEVQNLLNSGRMTQDQFTQLQEIANMFQRFIK